MSAVNKTKVRWQGSGRVELLHPRQAAGLISRGLVEVVKRKPRKKAEPVSAPEEDLSGAAPEGQDVVIAENEPHQLL